MSTSADPPEALVDTSVAVALMLADHSARPATAEAVRGRRLGLAGHAAFETFSVLTRLPTPRRRPPADIGLKLRQNFPATRFLSVEGAMAVYELLSSGHLAGGAVYDALVGAAAKEHRCVLLTRDSRARASYQLVGAEIELLA